MQSAENKRLVIAVDTAVPFVKGRLEPFAEVRYMPTADIHMPNIADADVIIGHTRTRYNRETLEGSAVKLALTCTIGMDHIDTQWCRDNGIDVRNAPGCNASAVAQYVWSSLLRTGFNPATDTLGIVGCGHVGSVVAEWGRLLGVKKLICDPPRQEKGEKPADGEEFLDMEKVLRESDAVTLHTPLTKDGDHPTYHLIGKDELKMMRANTMLVNAARGPVVDTAALKQEVLECRLRAIIDTWEGEPAFDRELLDMVEIGTFHIAGYSLEGKQRATRAALEAIAEKYNLPIDLSGLAEPYAPKQSLTTQQIVASYDPYADMMLMMQNPDRFDELRAEYKYRKEA